MFIIYLNLIAVDVVFSRDSADDRIAEICHEQGCRRSEFMVDFVQEDEDLYYSITSRA